MTSQKSVKPATEATVNGLQEVDRLDGLINFQDGLFSHTSQVVYRTRTRRSRWIIVRRKRKRGWSRSIPVYVRRSELLWGAVSGGAS
jgi:hypothetical protein